MSARDHIVRRTWAPPTFVWQGILAGLVLTGTLRAADQPVLQSLGADPETSTSAAAPGQTEAVLDTLERVLKAADSDLGRVVKLNVYVNNEKTMPAVQARIKARWKDLSVKPAVTYAITPLPRSAVAVALDAVAASSAQVDRIVHRRVEGVGEEGLQNAAHVTLMPPGRTIYISGQAEPGKTIAEATHKTLEGLDRTLKHIGLDKSYVVQVKSFVQPMSEAMQIDQELAQYFGKATIPAFSHVEWVDKKPSIETELIVWAPYGWIPRAEAHVDGPGSAQFVYLPWLMPNSPNFCRLTIVDQSRAIYFGGLFARTAETPEEEVRDVFRQLRDLLKQAGSDYDHLAKATYYPSTEATSTKLNTIRPEFYNGKRPPAASKAPLRGCGRLGRNLTLDMIAVTPAK